MPLPEDARQRLRSVLDEISRIAEYEFPYKGSEAALKRLEQVFNARLASLNTLTPQSLPAAVRQACSLALGDIVNNLPLLGFIVRSTNVRNAFEVLRPLLRMAGAVLEPGIQKEQRQTQLIISSEWQYSPLIYRGIPELPGFVLIGFPAPESSNPLLLPLAGHEFGHSVWVANAVLRDAIRQSIYTEIIAVIQSRWAEYQQVFPHMSSYSPDQLDADLYAIETWLQAQNWALDQAEEVFCDCLGLRLFGASYMEAFACLLAPCMPGERSVLYPNTTDRVQYLTTAAGNYSVTVPPNFQVQFEDNPIPQLTRQDEFRLELADQAVMNTLPTIMQQANQVVAASLLPSSTSTEVNRIYSRYKLVVPAEKCICLADILNAAWKAYRDSDFWGASQQAPTKRDEVLKELVLKNIEIFEIEQILGPTT
jgi:hypothetical protein